jgi:hypothetical protein
MGFLDLLKSYFSGESAGASDDARARIRDAWGLEDESSGAPREASSIAPTADADAPSAYDVAQWRKKLRRIFEELPASQPEWAPLMTEARAYHLDGDWISERLAEEFTLLIRSVVADRLLSEDDLARIETARKLIGITEAQAETAVRAIVADAEAFFGGSVVEES